MQQAERIELALLNRIFNRISEGVKFICEYACAIANKGLIRSIIQIVDIDDSGKSC